MTSGLHVTDLLDGLTTELIENLLDAGECRWHGRAMRSDESWDVDAARRYDTPGSGMFAPEVLGPTVDRLAELAGHGRALEFAIGTGRVAVPLAERGIPVTGIELSLPMIDELRTKPGSTAARF